MKKKILSLLLALAMILPMCTAFSLLVGAATDSDYSKPSSATSTETIYQNGIYYTIEKSTIYTGNGTYRMDIDIFSSLSKADAATQRQYAENGYLTVDQDGYYLIELWGGNGSKGGDTENIFGNVVHSGGAGGAAGYVYAKIWLNKGQTLVWSIGTNGASMEVPDEAAGGANGDGGDHGEAGSKVVGSGGGYSALFLFEQGEFETNWVTATGPLNIPETARVSRYIMIAGGGGGGGAANSIIYDHAKDSYNREINANGGAGGSINRGISMTLNSATVPGYVFSGRNGLSTGNMTDYVGRGGTNTPGAVVSTKGGLITYSATPGPNDWAGTYTMDYYDTHEVAIAPGAGGSGNLRGGGGGAGYAGGSGGIMSALTIASQIGGGGGGSSFLAQSVNGETVQFGSSMDAESSALLNGTCPSSSGGALCYTYLGGGGDTVIDTSFLSTVAVSGVFSQYFTVTQMQVNGGAVDGSYINGADNSKTSFEVPVANILPSTMTSEGRVLHLQFTLTPKSGFAGGNNVPLLEDVRASFVNNNGENEEVVASYKAATDSVNVALSLILTTYSFMSNDATKSYALTELYKSGEHPMFTGGSNTDWKYAFVESITNPSNGGTSAPAVYEGKDGVGGSALSGSVTPTETKYYSVVMEVTPKGIGSYAKVGPKNTSAEYFYGIACVAIVTGDLMDFNTGETTYTVNANKYLTHNGTAYVYTQEFTQTAMGSVNTASAATYTYASNGTNPTAYVAAEDGYYLIQAWGARGGNGGNASATAKGVFTNEDTRSASGGSSGTGGYVYRFIHLKAGDSLSLTLGAVGAPGDSMSRTWTTAGRTMTAHGTRGLGGAYASVSLTRADGTVNKSYVVIAGGGGGGGGAAVGNTTTDINEFSYSGGTGSSAGTGVSTTLSSIGDYSGSEGSSGSTSNNDTILSPSGSAGGGGSAGSNYANATYTNAAASENEVVMLNELINTLLSNGTISKPSYNTSTTSGSAVQITPICMDSTVDHLNEMQDISTEGSFSRYFDVENVEMVVDGYTFDNKTVTNNGDGSVAVAYTKSGKTQYSYTYKLTENADGTTEFSVTDVSYAPSFEISVSDKSQYTAILVFDVVFTLNPKEGFFGGNDVPLLEEGEQVSVTHHGITHELSAREQVDYANVAVTYDLEKDFSASDATIALGDSVQTGDLWELTTVWPLGDESWKADFVTLSVPQNNTLSPTATTDYDLTVSILPTTATPQKALVIGATSGKTATVTATVYVTYTVTYTLTNMHQSGPDTVLSGTALTVILSPASGYNMPSSVTVKVGGSTSSNFTFNTQTGTLVISADAVTGPIEIIAAGVEVTYAITYYWEDENGTAKTHTESYTAGAAIDYNWLDNQFSMPAQEGYEFSWSFDTETDLRPETMPAHNLMVTGIYTKLRFTLTIQYVNSAGVAVSPAHTASVEWEAAYSVLSPVVEGYTVSSATDQNGTPLANPYTISGTMPLSDVTITVLYLSSKNEVVIVYVDTKGNEMAETYRVTVAVGGSYQKDSPAITGYTPDITSVSGTMESEQSITVVVTYSPNKYTVSLQYQYTSYPDGGFNTTAATVDGRVPFSVIYDNVYGYNNYNGESVEDYGYGLPTPVIAGYTFMGWYADASFTTPVTESTVVSTAGNITLYAKWEATAYRLTIMYYFVYDSGDFLPDLTKLPANAVQNGIYHFVQYEYVMGAPYDITLPQIAGYTAYTDFDINKTRVTELTGTMPGDSVVFYVAYEINTYTVHFMDRGVANGTSDVDWPDYTSYAQTGFDSTWQVVQVKHGVSPVFTGANPSHATEAYTFTFAGWKDSQNVAYGADVKTFPATIGEVSGDEFYYYAQYTATENVALVINAAGTVIGYHTTLASAVSQVNGYTGATTMDTAVTLQLRRNPDVAQVIDHSATISISNSSTLYLRFDLHGIKLNITQTNTNGAVTSVEYVCLIDSVGGGELYTESTGNATAWYQTTYNFYLGAFNSTDERMPARITAISTGSGTARGVYTSGSYYLYIFGGTVSATSDSGIAYGVYRYNSNSTYYLQIYEGTISAVSNTNTAYGVYSTSSTALYDGANISARSNGGIAYGIYASRNLDLTASAATNVHASSTDGNAYGIYVASYTSYVRAGEHTISATSTNGNAYGAYTTSTFYVYSGNNALSATSTNGIAYGIQSTSTLYSYVGAATDEHFSTATAHSANNNAFGVHIAGLSNGFFLNVVATAPCGTATGVYSSTTSSYSYGSSTEGIDYTIKAEGNVAIALHAYRGSIYLDLEAIGVESATALKQITTTYAFTVGSTSKPTIALTATATGNESSTAVGMDLSYTATLYANVISQNALGSAIGVTTGGTSYAVTMYEGASVTAATESGNAYAFKNAAVGASSTSVTGTVAATATSGNAYAFANATMNSFSTAINVSATATTGNAYGFAWSGTGSGTLNTYARVTVSSESGNAYGFFVENGTANGNGTMTISADLGTAYGAYITGGTLTPSSTLTVTADRAYGARVEGGTLKLSSSSFKMTVKNPVEADSTEGEGEGEGGESEPEPEPEPPSVDGALYGIYVTEGGTLNSTVAATVTVTATRGNAYGVYNLGTVTSLGAVISVTAPYLTYGIENAAGVIATATSTLKITATSQLSTAYAVYASGGSVGTEGYDGSIQYGIITGVAEAEGQNAYAFYADGGYVYIRGSDLYYKGSVDGNHRFGDVVICPGYEEQKAADQTTYPDYYVLVVIEYKMIFIERDLAGNEVFRTEFAYNTEMTAIAEPEFTASYEGHTLHWSEYDFMAPTEGYSKEVLSYHTVNQYTITFQLNGGTGTQTMTVYYAETIVWPTAPTKYGYSFTAWYDDEALTALTAYVTMPATDFTVWAAYEIGTFTITIVSNGGPAMDPITDVFGTAVPTPADPVRTGYVFKGWYADEALTTAYTFSTIPGEDITVYMKWELGKFTITVNTAGGPTISAITGDYNSAVTAPAIPDYYGYSFAGWYADSAYTVPYTFSTIPAENITVYLKWQIGTFSIIFVSQGTTLATVTDVFGTAVSAPATPSRTGYRFVGWYEDSGFNTAYTVSTIPGENITVYAKWELVNYILSLDGASKEYTVYFYNNRTSSDSSYTVKYSNAANSFQTIIAPTPTRDSNSDKYVFAGWYTSRPTVSNSITSLSKITATRADLQGDLSELDPDGDGNIYLYAGWIYFSYFKYGSQLTTENKLHGYVCSNNSSNTVICTYQYDGGTSTSWGWHYITHSVSVSGTYTVSFLNYRPGAGSNVYYKKAVELYVYHADGTRTTIYTTGAEACQTADNPSYYVPKTLQAQAGDLIVLQVSDYASSNTDEHQYDTYFKAYLSQVPDGYGEGLQNGVSYVYTVESADIALPMDAIENQAGWSWMVGGALANRVITAITPDLIGLAPAWSDPDNPQILYLYAVQEQEKIVWTVYVESGRRFEAFDTTLSSVTIRADRAVAILFNAAELESGSTAKLLFNTGLPVGTQLTLVDLSGSMPAFYSYTVTTNGLKELSLAAFTLMGTTDQYFSGCSTQMLISVSYANTTHSITNEQVGLSVNGELISVSCSYELEDDIEGVYADDEIIYFPYNFTQSSEIGIGSMGYYGYESTDRVLVRITMLDKNGDLMVRPAGFALGVPSNPVYHTSTATLIDAGSVEELKYGGYVPIVMNFDEFRYLYPDCTVMVEILVVPDYVDVNGASINSAETTLHMRGTLPLVVIDNERIAISMIEGDTVTAGSLITMNVAIGKDTTVDGARIRMFIYQSTENGLAYTDDCATLIDRSLGIKINPDGEVVSVYENGYIATQSGYVQTKLPDDSAEGTYYVVIWHGDRFDTLVLHVTPKA